MQRTPHKTPAVVQLSFGVQVRGPGAGSSLRGTAYGVRPTGYGLRGTAYRVRGVWVREVQLSSGLGLRLRVKRNAASLPRPYPVPRTLYPELRQSAAAA